MRTLRERWEGKVDRTPGWGPQGMCWKWTGATFSGGYGCLMDGKGRITGAHRLAWQLAHGAPAPRGLDVMHTCNWKPGVNWDHLVLGTRSKNVDDATRDGLRPISTRLTPQQVLEIRASRKSDPELAAEYGVGRRNVYDIRHCRTWRWVTTRS
jgi:hypothetical protein